MPKKDLIGVQYGKWTILEKVDQENPPGLS